MIFVDAIKKMKIQTGHIVLTDEFGYWNFNIDFINSDGYYDQTQLDVYPYQFDCVQRQCEALRILWKEFCKENGFKQNSITNISLVNQYFTVPQYQ